jgi:hypothetical protein
MDRSRVAITIPGRTPHRSEETNAIQLSETQIFNRTKQRFPLQERPVRSALSGSTVYV